MKKDLAEISENKSEQLPIPSQKEYIEIRLPRVTFKDAKINTYLVITLVIFSFFLGMLTNKVLSLENTLKNQVSNTANAQSDINAPSEPPLPDEFDVSTGNLPILGSDNAKVTIVVFSDFQCPFCKQFVDNSYTQILDTYVKSNKIKFAFRHYPLTSIHANAQKASEAGECANEQNKFWNYHDLLFKKQTEWSPQSTDEAVISFTNYASELGLNINQFQSCLNNDKYKDKVEKDIEDGNKAGVDGTPTLFINGTRLVGAQPFSQIKQLIEKKLNK